MKRAIETYNDRIEDLANERVQRSELKPLLDAALKEYFIEVELVEPDDVGFNGQFLVDGVWYTGKYGCDSLQMFIDKVKSI